METLIARQFRFGSRFSVSLSTRHRTQAALLLTLFQVALSFCVAQAFPHEAAQHFAIRGFGTPNAYERTCAADCLWYAAIAEQGYHSSIPPTRIQEGESNVAFFPAYPILVWATHGVASIFPGSISWPTASLLASQIATAGFWFLLFAFAEIWGIAPGVAAFVAFAVLSHPSSLFMVEGHSESLYMAAIMGLLWCGEVAPGLGAIPGAVLSATRVLGFGFLLYPALRWLRASGSRRRGWIVAAAGTCVGGIAFFVYCRMRFGVWGLYFQTQHLGWGHTADYWFLLRSGSYRLSLPFRKSVDAGIIALAFVALVESRLGAKDSDRQRTWTRRALLVTAAAQFYLAGAGGAHTDGISTPFVAFGRYTLPIALLAALVLADQFRVLNPSPRNARIIGWVTACACMLSLVFLNVLRETVTHLRG